jgi:hypothetical protein
MFKKKFLLLIQVAIIAGLVSSCSLFKSTPKGETSRVSTFRTVEVHTLPVTADLQIESTKKSGVATGQNGTSLEKLKNDAIRDVLTKNAGDVLVVPSYLIETNEKGITVTETGYVGKYSNFKQGSLEGTPVITVHPGETPQVQQPAAEPKKKGVFGLFQKK